MGNTPKLPPKVVIDATNPTDKPATSRAKRHKSAKTHNGLTEKQEHFSQLIAEGYNYSQAYRAAYNTENMKPASVWHAACQLANTPTVSGRINDLIIERNKENSAMAETRAARVCAFLESMIEKEEASDAVRLRAADLLGKTVGLYTDRVETSGKDKADINELERKLEALLSQKPRVVKSA